MLTVITSFDEIDFEEPVQFVDAVTAQDVAGNLENSAEINFFTEAIYYSGLFNGKKVFIQFNKQGPSLLMVRT